MKTWKKLSKKGKILTSIAGVAILIVLGFAASELFEKDHYWPSEPQQGYAEEGYYDSDESFEGEAEPFGLATSDLRSTGGLAMDQSTAATATSNANIAADGSSTNEATKNDAQKRMVIKTANISLVVKDVREAIAVITTYAEQNGGFITNSSINKWSNVPSGSITVRIPVDQFAPGVENIKSLGEVNSENISGEDVTKQYVDLENELKNLQATRDQLREIMARAFEIEDILAVQRELTVVQNDIERIQGTMKYLADQTSLSTITINLSTDSIGLPVVEENSWKPIAVVKDATRSLIELGQEVVNGLIWVVIYAPVWLLALLIGWLIWRKVRG